MAQAKKFGTFSGVFTPSILTILGVIMYLRLPWIIGQAGLWGTIGIVIVAHIISVTTGLSVSSIATDKKVKAGGTYYMISRSLGLPIGGTLGLALFVGLSFSVSLYLIGFSESFLGYWGIPVTKNTIRIAGTAALLAVTTITFISTALALRSQFFILGAIIVSLLSILFGQHELAPAEPLLQSIPSAAPWMVLFGIFFPAVTGFEAGVSMSGDLKDPKRSIPVGTIAAISVGLVVYLCLAAYFAFTVNSEALVNDPNVLLNIALWSPAVIAGIWAATLSSALGSILGAPRILQAASADRISPRLFARGYGRENEPRNALLLTFAIAEVGILIGELNVIARVVSMFFITTYGFLNLSCALEIWASSDFRPDFRIPKTVSIIGSISCFIVMILLDFVAMLGATVTLGGLFLYLKRKELTLESGDTWEGVWSSIVRSGLQRLSKSTAHQRNWRPNIILFSGGSEARPHLVELGEWLVRKRGILSNFELVENARAKTLFPKTQQSLKATGEEDRAIFTRRLECRDIYEGMETVAQVYGFSGIDPNTVMLGWARHTRDPRRFAGLIGRFADLDYNILLLDYDRERGFGEKQRIDLWWRGGNNNATLALTMLKFLQLSDEWQSARARILIVIENSGLVNRVHKNMLRILEEQRVDAEVTVINNAIEKRSFPEIITLESQDADLTMVGLPLVNDQNAAQFVAQTDTVVKKLGSVLLIHASSYFETLYVGIEEQQTVPQSPLATRSWPELSAGLPAINLALPALLDNASFEMLAKTLKTFHQGVEDRIREYHQQCLNPLAARNQQLLEELGALAERIYQNLEKNFPREENPRYPRLLSRAQSDFLFQSRQILSHFQQDTTPAESDLLQQGVEQLLGQLQNVLNEIPPTQTVFYEPETLKPHPEDSLYLRLFKFRKRLRQRWFKKPISQKIPLRRLAEYHLATALRNALYQQLQTLGADSFELVSDAQRWINSVRDSLGKLSARLAENRLGAGEITTEKERLGERAEALSTNCQQQVLQQTGALLTEERRVVNDIWQELLHPDTLRRPRRQGEIPKSALQRQEDILAVPESWRKTQVLVINFALMDLHLLVLQNRLSVIVQKFSDALIRELENNILDELTSLAESLESYAESISDTLPEKRFHWSPGGKETFDDQAVLNGLRGDVRLAVEEMPETVEIISEEDFQQIEQRQFEVLATVTVSLRRLVDYLVDTRLMEPLQKELAELSERLEEAWNVKRDVLRLITFQLADVEASFEAGLENPGASLQNIILSGKSRLAEECQNLEELIQELQRSIDLKLHAAQDKMSPYVAIRHAGKLGQYIRTEESRKVLSEVGAGRERIENFFKNILVKLLYRRSEGVLLAQRFWQSEADRRLPVERTLILVESVSPDPAVLNALPLYYRQLFQGKQAIGKEFWVGRDKTLRQAEVLVQRYRQGFRGGLLVLGERLSGKTALSRAIAQRFFHRQHIYQLFAPEQGSLDPALFQKTLQEAVQINGSYREIFTALPTDSVVIINDLELWWERTPGEMAVPEQIVSLLNEYSTRCCFIINANVASYRLMNRLKPLEEVFLGAIYCEPFDAEDLQQAILLRHQSTGLTFELNGQPEDRLSQFKLARLFNDHFDFSAGNIGVALQAWLSHIEDISGDRLSVRAPQRPPLNHLASLNPEWAFWLQQFVLHKHLTPQRLRRLFQLSAEEVEMQLSVLRRAGLLVEIHPDVWEINPYLQSFITQMLNQKEYL